jgi:hypothetical protein
MSYAVWREVLGVDAGVDTGNWPVTPTSMVVVTPATSPTPVQLTEVSQPTATVVLPTELAPSEVSVTDAPPVELPPTDLPTTNPTPTEEATITPAEPPAESPTEPPGDAATPSESG